MNIKVKLDSDFSKKIIELDKKYGEEFTKMNGFHTSNLNFTEFIDNFTKDNDSGSSLADFTIDPNANNYMRDIPSMMREMNKAHSKLLSYNKIYYEMKKKYGIENANLWIEKEWNGEFYLHNSHNSSFIPYCFSFSVKEIAEKGLFFLGKFKTTNAKHLDTFNNHVLEFVSYASNRISGACGLGDILIWQYYFYKKDKESKYLGITDFDKYRDQQFQTFIYNLNQPYLRQTESAFTNVTIYDREYLVELFGTLEFPDGTFGIEQIEDIMEFQRAFMKVVSDIRSKTIMTFPVLTISLLYQEGKFVDEETARWANKHNMEWYDSNFYIGDSITALSSCCRIISNFSEMDRKSKELGFINSIGGTSLKVGSVQVNTTNLARLAYDSDKNFDTMLSLIDRNIKLSLYLLDTVRGIIKRNVEKGLLPMYDFDLIDMNRQFSTLGITGMYSAIDELGGISTDEFGNRFYTDRGREMACLIMDRINAIKDEFTKDYLINLEAVPGESCNVKSARKDTLLYGFDKVKTNIYGNQWIPLTEKCTNKEKIELSALLDRRSGGGAIGHYNIESSFSTEEQSWDMLNYIASKGVIYFAYNVKISACEDNHGFFGDKCYCGKPAVETYSRVVG